MQAENVQTAEINVIGCSFLRNWIRFGILWEDYARVLKL